MGFMKTLVAFFDKKREENVMKPGYQFVDDDNGKRTCVKFKWEGDDLKIDNSNLYLQEIKHHTGTITLVFQGTRALVRTRPRALRNMSSL